MNVIVKSLETNVTDMLKYDKGNAVEEIIKIVFEALLQAERGHFLKTNPEQNKANGYYSRLIRSVNDYFRLSVPRDRLSLFKPALLEILKQGDERMQDLAYKLYVKGLTTREISSLLEETFGKKMSPGAVSHITKDFEEQRIAWQERPLEESYYFVYIDAIWISLRRGSRVTKEAFYTVVGLKSDLTREILGVYNIPSESASGWNSAFQDLKDRGVKKILMLVADGLTGLDQVVYQAFDNTFFQTCVVHKKRNILNHVRPSDKPLVAHGLSEVFKVGVAGFTIDEAIRNMNEFVDKWGKNYPRIKNQLNELDAPKYFAYLQFPPSIQRMVYTTNWVERLNRDIRRTQKMRNSFPNPDSAANLICGSLMEFERRVYRYPITSFKVAKSILDEMLFQGSQTHKTVKPK